MSLSWDTTRHAMLAEIDQNEPGERRVSLRRRNPEGTKWTPVRLEFITEKRMSAAERQAVLDLREARLVCLPYYRPGYQHQHQVLEVTAAGRRVLDEWNAEHALEPAADHQSG